MKKNYLNGKYIPTEVDDFGANLKNVDKNTPLHQKKRRLQK